MGRPYSELRQLLKARHITQVDVARRIDKSEAYVNRMLAGTYGWSQEDMYAIMEMLHAPYSKLHILFPLKGMYAGAYADPEPSKGDKMASAIRDYIDEQLKDAMS